LQSGQHVYTGASLKTLGEILKAASVSSISRYEGCRVYLDTFDWRLLKNGINVYLQNNQLTYLSGNKGFPETIKVRADLKYANELPPGNIFRSLTAATDIRAMMPVLRENIRCGQFALADRNKKTVLRLVTESVISSADDPVFLTLFPVKGYESVFTGFTTNLINSGFAQVESGFFEYLLKKHDISTVRYGDSKSYRISADMSVAGALREIHCHLLHVMQENEDGIINDIDTEFLHDFRVAVRRTRSLYGEVREHIDPGIFAAAKHDFSELGKRTNRLRDIDVYLLNRRAYKELLPFF
jgi:hypothetical protein